MRNDGAEKDTLRKAAESAEAMLPKLLRKKADFEERIESLRSVITAWEKLSGRKRRIPVEVAPAGEATRPGRAKRGEVARHIEAVLSDGVPRSEPDIRRAIAEKFAVEYGRPTVYTALRRKPDRFTETQGLWKLAR